MFLQKSQAISSLNVVPQCNQYCNSDCPSWNHTLSKRAYSTYTYYYVLSLLLEYWLCLLWGHGIALPTCWVVSPTANMVQFLEVTSRGRYGVTKDFRSLPKESGRQCYWRRVHLNVDRNVICRQKLSRETRARETHKDCCCCCTVFYWRNLGWRAVLFSACLGLLKKQKKNERKKKPSSVAAAIFLLKQACT